MIALPRKIRLNKRVPLHFKISGKESKVIDELKRKLMFLSVFALAKSSRQFKVKPNAMNRQMGFVLLLEQKRKKLTLIEYCYRSLSNAKRDHDRAHIECLAVLLSSLMICSYLEGSGLVIRTVHQAQKWILDLKESIERPAQFRL